MNRGLTLNFWFLRSAKHVKFTEECVYREVCFSQNKSLQMG